MVALQIAMKLCNTDLQIEVERCAITPWSVIDCLAGGESWYIGKVLTNLTTRELMHHVYAL